MNIKFFVVGSLATNCYVVENEDTKGCVIIDPGAYSERITDYIKDRGLAAEAILLTHGHFDHILGIDKLLKEFPVPVYAHEAEAELLRDKNLNMSAPYGCTYVFTGAKYVRDNEILELAGIKFKVLYTPGHTNGSCCYYVEDENVLFSGDTLFKGAVGITQIPTGSAKKLRVSLNKRLFALPDGTKVYPGHKGTTYIGYEKNRG